MLVDHPASDSDGSPKDICGVWLDAKLDPPNSEDYGLVYGLLMPSGRNGEDLKDHLRNGLKVGTSSSGFGKLLSDGVTVDPDTYLIERLSDWVLNPSQGTYFTYDESDDGAKNASENIKESVTTRFTEERKNVKDSKYTRLEEKKFRKDMESFLESAIAIKDPRERLQEFREINSYLDDGACPDLREKIQERIAEEEAFIEKAINEKLQMKEKFDVDSASELEVKITKLVQESAQKDKEATDWKGVAEKLQEKIKELTEELEARPTQTFVEYQKNKYDKLSKEFDTLDDTTEKNVEKARALNKDLMKKIKLHECTIQNLESEKGKLFESMADSRETIAQSKAEIKTFKEALSNLSTEKTALLSEASVDKASRKQVIAKLNENVEKLMDRVADDNKKLIESARSINALNKKVAELESEKKSLQESLESKDNKLSESIRASRLSTRKLSENVSKGKRVISQKESEIEALKEKVAKLEAVNKKQSEVIENSQKLKTVTKALQEKCKTLEEANKNFALTIDSQREAIEEKTFKESTEVPESVKKTNLFESTMGDVKSFYKSLYESYGEDILPFREKILSCNTLAEAKQFFYTDAIQNMKESKEVERARIPENLTVSPEERISVMDAKFTKDNMLNRKPKGWY